MLNRLLLLFLFLIVHKMTGQSSSTFCPALGSYYNTTYSQCVCTNPSQRIDPTNSICSSYHCNGYHSDPKACSGHGRCVYPSLTNCPNEPLNDPGICSPYSPNPVEFCSCDKGYDGSHCEIILPTYDECDCGVRWDPSFMCTSTSVCEEIFPVPAGATLLSDMAYAPWLYSYTYSATASNTTFKSVRNVDQAKELCYTYVPCAGFALAPTSSNLYYFLPFEITFNTNGPFLPPVGFSYVWLIDRTSLYRCPNLNLDANYYCANNPGVKQAVLTFANQIYNTLPAAYVQSIGLENFIAGGNCGDTGSSNNYWTHRHWAFDGHKARLRPNTNCVLGPPVFLQETGCQYAGCASTTASSVLGSPNKPCVVYDPVTGSTDLNGYCLPTSDGSSGYQLPSFAVQQFPLLAATNGSTGMQCQCLTAADVYSVPGNIEFGFPFFQGLACEISVLGCIQPNANTFTLCNGISGSICSPTLLWNGLFPLGTATNQLATLTQAACNCDATPYTSTYCQISRCGINSNGCLLTNVTGTGVVSSGGSCLPASEGAYSCVCPVSGIGFGQYCNLDATPCMFNGLQCDGLTRGTCAPPNVNFTTNHCVCQTGYIGTFCQITDCTSDELTPGHGICHGAGVTPTCYAPYCGTQNCAIDNCATTGGVVTGSDYPTSCNCPIGTEVLFTSGGTGVNCLSNTIPSCWPTCPSTGINQTCGSVDLVYSQGTHHLCLQTQDGNGIRTATCQCAFGYNLVPDPITGVSICQKYCVHGNVPSNWSPGFTGNCICDRSTGFNTLLNSPTCNNPICYNRGIFSSITELCTCFQPYLTTFDCFSSTCAPSGFPVENINPLSGLVYPTAPYKCACNSPYVNSNPFLPYDCSATICGENGLVNALYNSATQPISQACLCAGKYKTVCLNSFTCAYCKSSFCLNGGFPYPNNPNLCQCPFPFINGPANLCELDFCNITGTASVDTVNKRCVCNGGFTGSSCNLPYCQVGGTYNTTTQICNCPYNKPCFLNPDCTIYVCPVNFNISSSSSSTGPFSSSTAVNNNNTTSSNTLTTQQIILIAGSIAAGIAVVAIVYSGYYFLFMHPSAIHPSSLPYLPVKQ